MPQGKDVVPGRRSVGGAGGTTSNRRNAFCSFCRKSYRDVGPLVEGPGDVYICGECIELCQSILDQEQKRKHKKRLKQTAARIYHYVDDELCYRIDNMVDVLPKAVQKWAGIKDKSGNVSFINRGLFAYETLVDMNDGGCTFNRIAKVIEKHAEGI